MLIPAYPSDAEDIVSLTSSCIHTMRESGLDQWDDVYPSRSRIEQDIANRNLFVLRKDVLVGCVTIDGAQSPEYASVDWLHKGAPILVFHRLMVHPHFQGKGYAKLIMREAEQIAMERSAYGIRLDAFALNSISLRLYESLNYRIAGEVKFRKGVFICYEKKLQK